MGGFRMRKSMKVAPGVRLNVSKRGVGASVGAGGVRYSAHSTGRRTVSARPGIPGGVYYQSTKGGSRKGSASRPAAGSAPSRPATPPKPGLFAPKGEKELYKAIKAQDVQAIKRVGDEHPDFQVPAYSLAGLMVVTDEPQESKRMLETVFATGQDPAADKFVSKYLHTEMELQNTPGVTAQLPVSRDAVGLTLAELYVQAQRYEDAIELTEGVENEDDASALLLVFRGVAFSEQGFHDAAHEAFKSALRSRSRAAPIRHHALFERAQNYRAQGKAGMARKDLERI